MSKSTLLRNIGAERGYNYVTLDNPLDRAAAKSEPRAFLSRHKPPVIIDEIQYATELLPYIFLIEGLQKR